MTTDGYREAGVDLGAADEALARIVPLARATHRSEVLGDLGGFAGLFDLASSGYRDPLLVATTDGVGTKAELARLTDRLDTIGVDQSLCASTTWFVLVPNHSCSSTIWLLADLTLTGWRGWWPGSLKAARRRVAR